VPCKVASHCTQQWRRVSAPCRFAGGAGLFLTAVCGQKGRTITRTRTCSSSEIGGPPDFVTNEYASPQWRRQEGRERDRVTASP
jgi:hypothetical protein